MAVSLLNQNRRGNRRPDVVAAWDPPWPPSWLAYLPFALAIGLAALHPLAEDVYHAAVREDGPVEWATALAYLAMCPAAAMLAWRCRRSRPALFFAVLAVLAFFVAGEEISWGQRLFGFSGPSELVSQNIQHESNVHNLLNGHLLHAVYIVVAVWGLVAGRRVARRTSWMRPISLFAPGPRLAWWFAPAAFYYLHVETTGALLLRVIGDRAMPLAVGPARFQEVVEWLMAVGFLLYLVDARRRMDGGPAT